MVLSVTRTQSNEKIVEDPPKVPERSFTSSVVKRIDTNKDKSEFSVKNQTDIRSQNTILSNMKQKSLMKPQPPKQTWNQVQIK